MVNSTAGPKAPDPEMAMRPEASSLTGVSIPTPSASQHYSPIPAIAPRSLSQSPSLATSKLVQQEISKVPEAIEWYAIRVIAYIQTGDREAHEDIIGLLSAGDSRRKRCAALLYESFEKLNSSEEEAIEQDQMKLAQSIELATVVDVMDLLEVGPGAGEGGEQDVGERQIWLQHVGKAVRRVVGPGTGKHAAEIDSDGENSESSELAAPFPSGDQDWSWVSLFKEALFLT